MRRLPLILMIAAIACITSCSLDNTNNEEPDDPTWREDNAAWYEAQKELLDENGNKFYEMVVPSWNPGAGVLMHWFNDRALTAGNLVPLETSTVDVKYMLRNYKGEAMDSSYMQVTYGDSIFRTKVTGVIDGWQIALQNMHVGDSVRVVIPYTQGYGVDGYGSVKGYSTLQFDVKLVDIPYYEIRN